MPSEKMAAEVKLASAGHCQVLTLPADFRLPVALASRTHGC